MREWIVPDEDMVCVDNRFELIAKYKAKLIEATNIETDKAEMDVIDNVLFRIWQMGWLDRLEQTEPLERRRGMRLIDADALRKAMYHAAFETDSDLQKWDSGCWIRYKLFENILEIAPTIETVPKDQLIKEMMEKYNEGLEKAISKKIFSLRFYTKGDKEEDELDGKL